MELGLKIEFHTTFVFLKDKGMKGHYLRKQIRISEEMEFHFYTLSVKLSFYFIVKVIKFLSSVNLLKTTKVTILVIEIKR